MDITRVTYLLFVAVSLVVYWIIPKHAQWIVLLIDSLFFYFVNAKAYTFVYMIISVLTVWGATWIFAKNGNAVIKRCILLVTLFVNIGLLAVLKYSTFFVSTINYLLFRNGNTGLKPINWLSSLAISFYTLQIVSYLLDNYWGTVEREKNPVKLLLYTSFFPLMISGPIQRYRDFHQQLFEEHRFEYDRVTHGVKRIAFGLFKKIAISNRIALLVDFLWSDPERYCGPWIIIAVVGFVVQLYTDFSGCMDIVIGVSECFGIKLTENFKAPLLSKSIQEFWQRWHITLGSWLRDYVMNPLLKSSGLVALGNYSKKKLGKKQGKKIPVYLAMFVLWFAMGLWHGGDWKYIVGEGFWYWFIIVIGQIFGETCARIKVSLRIGDSILWRLFQIIRTNLIFAFGMLFFRAESLTDSFWRIRLSVKWGGLGFQEILNTIIQLAQLLNRDGCVILLLSMFALLLYDVYLYKDREVISILSMRKPIIRWIVYCMIMAILCLSYNVVDIAGFAYAHF